MERAEIFQSVVKGSNFFTPIVDSYHTIGNHIIELSCSEKAIVTDFIIEILMVLPSKVSMVLL